MNHPDDAVEQFGRYVLLKKIGQGGMAEVFLARSVEAAAPAPLFVIKRLNQELERESEAVDLFLTEADVTMLLHHPNIVRVFDSGEINGRYYLAMEYIHGRNLEEIMMRLRLKGLIMDTDMAVYIITCVLRGLAYVHQAKTASGRDLGIVHRDVTPSNIFISSAGLVKLGDFGVAKLIGLESWSVSCSLKGKLGFLSPEQVCGIPPQQSIDLWAAAVVFFELLTGAALFRADTELETMLRIKAAKVPNARAINPQVPKELAAILTRALKRHEKQRYPSAQAFLLDLEGYSQHWPRPITPADLAHYLAMTLA